MPHRWSELPPQDVLRILRELAARDGQAQSGFLDTHQWAPLAGEGISISLSGGHPQAQFRRAGIGLQPQVAITCLPGLPPAVNSLRMLRGWLYRNGAPDGSLGDIAQTANR